MDSEDIRANDSRSSAAFQIIDFPAAVDSSNGVRVGSRLFAACRPSAGVVVADLSHTELLDTFGMRCLLVAADQASVCGAELRIVITSPAVLRVLELAEVERRLRIYPSLDDALTGRRGVGEHGAAFPAAPETYARLTG